MPLFNEEPYAAIWHEILIHF